MINMEGTFAGFLSFFFKTNVPQQIKATVKKKKRFQFFVNVSRACVLLFIFASLGSAGIQPRPMGLQGSRRMRRTRPGRKVNAVLNLFANSLKFSIEFFLSLLTRPIKSQRGEGKKAVIYGALRVWYIQGTFASCESWLKRAIYRVTEDLPSVSGHQAVKEKLWSYGG